MKKNMHAGLLLALSLACSYEGWADSGATDRSNAFGYQFTQEELDSFPQKTNLPTVYLQIYKTTYDAETGATSFTLDDNGKTSLESLDYIFKDENKFEWYYKTKLTIRDDYGSIKERNDWLGVRGRGNSTWYLGYGQNKPLRLKFLKKTDLLTRKVDGTEVNDYATSKSWTLLANHYDATLIRNALAHELQKLMGFPFCPAYKFVDLVVNRRYMGTYQISDHVQIATRRVPINEDTGYLLEANRYDGNGRFQEDPYVEIPFGNGNKLLVNVKSPDPDIATPSGATNDPKYDSLIGKLNKVVKLVYAQDAQWRRHVDFKSAVNAFVAMEITGNYDGAVASDYFYMADLESKITCGPLWDFDLAWSKNCSSNEMTEKHFWQTEWTPMRVLIEKVYEDKFFVKAIYKRWKELIDGGLEKYLCTKIEELSSSIKQSATLNYTDVWSGGAGNSYSSTWADQTSYSNLDDAYKQMKEFVTEHLSYLDKEFEAQYTKLDCATAVCDEHDYDACGYSQQADGTYLRVCNICGEAEVGGDSYYQFTVYPESNNAESLYATSWEPSEEYPNAIATVKVATNVSVPGHNIVNATKNDEGDKVCADLRLVDGHPYYSDDKFVAAKATYSRSVKNTWGTMILPFKYQQAENKTAKFFHLDQQTTDDIGTLTLVMTPIDPTVEGNASAYTPVFFMRSNDDVETVTVEGENITVKKSTTATMTSNTLEGWTLTGVMEKTVFNVTDDAYTDKVVYYLSKDELWHAKEKLTTNPFRAYLSTAASNEARSIRLATGDEPSGVKSVDANECLALFVAEGQLTVVAPKQMDISVSSLGGAVVCRQRVQAGERLSLRLAKGVYVVNGVKIMIN